MACSNDNGEGYSVAQVLGQMEDAAMPYETLRATAQTFAARVVESAGAGVRRNLADGLSLINRIYAKRLDASDIGTLEAAASQSALEIDANGVGAGYDCSAKRWGAHVL